MRFWIGGPRLFGGMIRPGVSFTAHDLRFGAGRSPGLPAGGFVYVIEREDNGHVKVGSSQDPDVRRNNLQTGSSTYLRIVHTAFAGDRAKDVEIEAHGFLDAKRLEGEWFSVSPETAIAAIYAAAGRLGVPLGEDSYVERPRFFQTLAGKLVLIAAIILLLMTVSPLAVRPK